jgi:hypothetical protein
MGTGGRRGSRAAVGVGEGGGRGNGRKAMELQKMSGPCRGRERTFQGSAVDCVLADIATQ